MRWRGLASFGLLAVLALAIGGCTFFTEPGLETGGASEGLQAQSLKTPARVQTIDDLFAKVARRVPAFGGMFLSDDGQVLQVYLTDLKAEVVSAVEAAIAAVFGSESIPQGGIRAIRGQYGFLQLKGWHDRMYMVLLTLPGVTLTDIDDARNRLLIGVEKMEMLELVEQELAKLGIPGEAFIIEQAGPVEVDVTLRDRVRPVVGGLQIAFGDNYTCSLGFNAIRSGVSGFVTCSHCTGTQGSVDGTVFHQPTISGTANRIGIETVDPPFFTGGECPTGRQCRYSDSAFAQFDTGVAASHGFIARPVGIGSITIAGNFRIVWEELPMVNQTVERVGRTTGWRRGKVTNICVNVNKSMTNITLLCQYLANYYSESGDSGSPVFTITNSPNQYDVHLNGIHWGKTPWNIFWWRRIFSVIAWVQNPGELGVIDTCDPNLPWDC